MKIQGDSKPITSHLLTKKEHRCRSHSHSDDSMDEEQTMCSLESSKKSIKDYLRNSSLHGLKYLAEERITISERVFFGISFVLVVILSGFFISNIYIKWSASPIIISTSAKQLLTSNMPFPAITICNLNQALRSRVQRISRFSNNYTLLMSLCNKGDDQTITYVGTWKYFKALLVEVAQPCDEMLLYCSFGSQKETCSMIFNSILTDDGLCCTFNALDPIYLFRNYSDDVRIQPATEYSPYEPIDWTPERGYEKILPAYYYPRMSGGTGSRMGLTVVLNTSTAEYYCTKSMGNGFKVLVHNPAELPKVSNYGFVVGAGREARISVEPVYEDATPSIRSIKKSVRRCLFSDENDLSFYRTYSRKNCELECEAKLLLRDCKCVLYYLPRIDPMARICGPNDNNCTNRVQTDIESSRGELSCENCWPGCFELTYKYAMSSSPIIGGPNYKSGEDLPEHLFNASRHGEDSDLSILHFYYLHNNFRSTTKSEMFGFTEFLSNTGGILGLFMGFSIFSVIEIVYYVTIRPYCASRALREHRKRRLAKLLWLTPVRRQRRRRFIRPHPRPPPYSQVSNKVIAGTVEQNKQSVWQVLRGMRDPLIYPYLD
ncbi:pickpocket protein 28 [Drosophila grimshawi]|uniref:GH11924 n=1 Tax=Drosophila grimshawi TaxID=7222 RepID=B4JL61_DROGR|nr:pickpocket protein 28 [Drosophila grimshawi]EDW00314.1 GH11924 [Drosophila grimshawi]